MLLGFLVALGLTISIMTALITLALVKSQAKQIRALRQERDRDRQQMQLLQVRIRELREKLNMFIYVPKKTGGK